MKKVIKTTTRPVNKAGSLKPKGLKEPIRKITTTTTLPPRPAKSINTPTPGGPSIKIKKF